MEFINEKDLSLIAHTLLAGNEMSGSGGLSVYPVPCEKTEKRSMLYAARRGYPLVVAPEIRFLRDFPAGAFRWAGWTLPCAGLPRKPPKR